SVVTVARVRGAAMEGLDRLPVRGREGQVEVLGRWPAVVQERERGPAAAELAPLHRAPSWAQPGMAGDQAVEALGLIQITHTNPEMIDVTSPPGVLVMHRLGAVPVRIKEE